MTARNTIVLTIHNKEVTVARILSGLTNTLSADTDRIIIVLDGCTDSSQEAVQSFIRSAPPRFRFDVVSTDDIWETKANNVGLRMVESPYATILQDDMLLKERSWDRKLLDVFGKVDVFAVTGRTSHDFTFANGQFTPINLVGREYPLGSIGLVARVVAKLMAWFHPYWIYRFIAPTALRLTANRGPLTLRMDQASGLDFFDEQFAPFELDDVDLCCRAFKRYGLLSAARPVYYQEIGGSKANNSNSIEVSRRSIEKNTTILIERHSDLAALT